MNRALILGGTIVAVLVTVFAGNEIVAVLLPLTAGPFGGPARLLIHGVVLLLTLAVIVGVGNVWQFLGGW